MTVDDVFREPRLARLYDALDPDRSDLLAYLGLLSELGAHRVLDLGCGTGVLALLLAARGDDVVGLDPAGASLDVARGKPGSDHVRWVQGTALDLAVLDPPLDPLHAVVAAGNMVQAVLDPEEWSQTLRAVYAALRPGGHLVFETRDPAFRGWEEWTPDRSRFVTDVPGVGVVETWHELGEVQLPLVSFTTVVVLRATGEWLTSASTLRFRGRVEVEADLRRAGFVVREIRDAPDRPGKELVFVARRPDDPDDPDQLDQPKHPDSA